MRIALLHLCIFLISIRARTVIYSKGTLSKDSHLTAPSSLGFTVLKSGIEYQLLLWLMDSLHSA